MTAYIISLESRVGNFVAELPVEAANDIGDLPGGPYELVVSTEWSGHGPAVLFSFRHEATSEIMAEKHLDYMDHIRSIHAKYVEYLLKNSFSSAVRGATAEIEMKERWKIEALKDLFADRIEADDDFWIPFSNDLHKMLKPVAQAVFDLSVREAAPLSAYIR